MEYLLKMNIIFVTLIMIACSNNSIEEKKDLLEWMSKTSKVIVPDNISYDRAEIFTAMEWGKIIKFQLDTNEFESFVRNNRLANYSEKAQEMLLYSDIENLDFDKINATDKNEHLYLYDCITGFHWSILAHKPSRNIWFELSMQTMEGM